MRGWRWRAALSFLLLALTVLCMLLGSLFVWMRATAFDPKGYVAASLQVEGGALLRDRVVRFVQEEILPDERADALAAQAVAPLPITGPQKDLLAAGLVITVRSQVDTVVNAFLDSGAGRPINEALTTHLSEALVALVRNEPGVFRFQDDAIVLDTGPIVEGVRARLDDALGDLAQFLPPPREDAGHTITVVQGDYVVTIRNALSLIWLLAWLLPTLFVVLLAGGIIAARDRRRAALRTMVAIVVGIGIAAAAIRVARHVITDLVTDPATQEVVDAILTTATRDLVSQTLWVTFVVALAGIVLWIPGPGRAARHARTWTAARWRDLRAGVPAEAGRVTTQARAYRRYLEIAGVVIAAIVPIALPSVVIATWILALVTVIAWFLLIEYTACAPWMQAVANRIAGLRRTPTA